MMKFLEKLGLAEGTLGFIGRLLGWFPVFFGTTAAALISAWATRATELFKDYLPLAPVAAGLIGGILFMLFSWLWVKWRIAGSQLQFARLMLERPPPLNPLETVFVRQRIPMDIFMTPLREPVEKRTFTDCELVGPAVVLFFGSSISHAGFINCDFVRVVATKPILNAIPMVNAVITRGKLKNLTVLIPDTDTAKFPANTNWITPPP